MVSFWPKEDGDAVVVHIYNAQYTMHSAQSHSPGEDEGGPFWEMSHLHEQHRNIRNLLQSDFVWFMYPAEPANLDLL